MVNSGFTLIEILIVMAIAVVTTSLGLSVSLSSYRASIFRTDLRLVINSLNEARTQAMQYRESNSHGVWIESGSVVEFTGPDYVVGSISNRAFPLNIKLEDKDNVEIIFQPLSGSLSQPLSFTFSNGVTSKAININTEGVINY